MWIAHTRSSMVLGWGWKITKAADPDSGDKYGNINDYQNTYNNSQTYPLQPVALNIFKRTDGEDVNIEDGDWVTLAYDGGKAIKVYPPALSGDIDVYYYVSDNGSTYLDRELCQPARIAPPMA